MTSANHSVVDYTDFIVTYKLIVVLFEAASSLPSHKGLRDVLRVIVVLLHKSGEYGVHVGIAHREV